MNNLCRKNVLLIATTTTSASQKLATELINYKIIKRNLLILTNYLLNQNISIDRYCK